MYRLAHDATAELFILNALALYLFLPAPLLAPAAWFSRDWRVLAGLSIAAILFVSLWGNLLWSGSNAAAATSEPSFTVMTYNLFGFNEDIESILETIEAGDADVVALQELNPRVADAISVRLLSEYQYQFLEPRDGTSGMGVLSRHPARKLDITLPADGWVGEPQVLTVEYEGSSLTLLNIHSMIPSFYKLGERQSATIAEFARTHDQPLVVLGDFNATNMNRSYELVREELNDAWQSRGSGFGHTYPSSTRLSVFGVPKWLVRIDYVFYSDDWEAIAVRTSRASGGSDHRPVIANLRLKSGQ